ncbi:MAG: tetratricopeptide repeat protein [Bacteroidetes bacterium]|nr:tetratricopeptide repeat protein [Bacteroidota bacterium]
MRRLATLLTVALIWLAACSGGGSDLDEAVDLFYQNDMERALQSLQLFVSKHPDHSEARVWLAETYRRMGRMRISMEAAQRALELDPGQCFAHTVIADAARPKLYAERTDEDGTWIALNRAIRCDPSDGNAWMSIWNEAVLRRKPEMMRTSVARMRETGFFTDAVLAYARWTLRNLPENSILITNGDLDTIPMLAVQVTEDFRQDVVIVERGLLGTTQFLRYLRDDLGVTIPIEEAGLEVLPQIVEAGATVYEIAIRVFSGWITQKEDGKMTRPIAISSTVFEDFFEGIKDHLLFTGPYRLWQIEQIGASPAMAELETNLEGIVVEEFTGEWASGLDRSPIRHLYTKSIVTNITATAIAYCEGLLVEDRLDEARERIQWIESFEEATESGPAFPEKMAELKAFLEAD